MFSTKNRLTTHIEREHQSIEPNVLEHVNNSNNDTNPNVSTFENRAIVVLGPKKRW